MKRSGNEKSKTNRVRLSRKRQVNEWEDGWIDEKQDGDEEYPLSMVDVYTDFQPGLVDFDNGSGPSTCNGNNNNVRINKSGSRYVPVPRGSCFNNLPPTNTFQLIGDALQGLRFARRGTPHSKPCCLAAQATRAIYNCSMSSTNTTPSTTHPCFWHAGAVIQPPASAQTHHQLETLSGRRGDLC